MANRYLVGMFDDEVPLMNAIEKVRTAGIKIHDCVTPFPVHGIDDVLGAKETRLHTAGFVFGATGTTFALFCMTYISVFDWPNVFGGKPYLALPAWIPITFETTVLFCGVGTTIVYYLRNGLSIFNDVETYDDRLTSDRFGLIFDIESMDSSMTDKVTGMLRDLGAVEIKTRETRNPQPSMDEQAS